MPLLFLVLCAVGIRLAGLSLPFVAEEVLTRLCRDTVLALALILPITAGMGLNFALPVGAMAAQGGLLIAACAGLSGGAAVGTALAVALPLAALLGALIGTVLNRVKGREMIVSIVIGLLGSNLYQLLCLGVPGRCSPWRIRRCSSPREADCATPWIWSSSGTFSGTWDT
jgi:simple sugar transport system permease protein